MGWVTFWKKNVFIPRSFLVINACNQGKTLCSHCIYLYNICSTAKVHETTVFCKINFLLYPPRITISNGYRENERRQENACCTVLSIVVNREIHIKISESVSHTTLCRLCSSQKNYTGREVKRSKNGARAHRMLLASSRN